MEISNRNVKYMPKHKGMNNMITALNVANNILLRGFNENIDISPMKLQKLIYFVYQAYLKETNSPLFNERFEVWKYGPVVRTVYDEFKSYHSNGIREFYKECDNSVIIGNEEASAVFKRAIDQVWNKYKYTDGIALSEITHKQNSAWWNALNQNKRLLEDTDILQEEVSG